MTFTEDVSDRQVISFPNRMSNTSTKQLLGKSLHQHPQELENHAFQCQACVGEHLVNRCFQPEIPHIKCAGTVGLDPISKLKKFVIYKTPCMVGRVRSGLSQSSFMSLHEGPCKPRDSAYAPLGFGLVASGSAKADKTT